MEVAWGRREARQSLPATRVWSPGSKQAGELGKTKQKDCRGRKRRYDGLSGNGGTHAEVLRYGKLSVFLFAGVRCWQSRHGRDKRAGGL